MAARKRDVAGPPDFGRLEKVLRREGEPDRAPFYELFSNIQPEVLRALGLFEEPPPAEAPAAEREAHAWRQHIAYQAALGYDYANCGAYGFGFPQSELPRAMTTEGERSYHLASSRTIASRADFERYPWPDMAKVDYSPLERIKAFLPDGMKVIPGSSGVLENVMWLLGYEGISYLLYEDEALVRDMFDTIGSRITEYLGKVATLDVVGAVQLGDDLGFRTQTLISPAALREYVFPWHKRIVEAVHAAGKPAILHACGNVSEVMEDIIACGWDAKHSFEDAIEPVWEAKARWGDRITLLGGFDMDKLCRMSIREVRRHTRFLIERCAPGGGWALGTGNSVANYVPVGSFLAMLEEGRRGESC
ncbi:MAG: uroporphyrinogen-III decarboxylase-like protein [Planctomycetes bacterium]|nr:uroporphyrinogen-III decarboxylase-like protein [Planctomycetota bacterium]